MHHTSSSGPGRCRQSRSSIMQGSIWLHMLIVALVLVKSAGCFPAGSKISTLDGRRAGWFPAGSQMSTADGRRSDTGPDDAPGGLFLTSAGNAIVLDHSELSLLDCPGQATNSTIALTSHGGPIHKVTASVVPSRIMVLTGFKCNYPPRSFEQSACHIALSQDRVPSSQQSPCRSLDPLLTPLRPFLPAAFPILTQCLPAKP